MAYSGGILNGNLEKWTSATAPTSFNQQTTNTTVSRLQRDQQYNQSPGVHAIKHVLDQAGSGIAPGPLVYEGLSSYRATLVAAASADEWRIWGPGASLVAALTGAAGQNLPYEPIERHVFSVMARSSVPGNLLTMVIVLRDASDNIIGGIDANGFVQSTIQTPDVALHGSWHRHAIHFIAPPAVGNTAVEHVLWQLRNGSAEAQVIDIDDIRFGPQFEHEEA